MAEVIKIAASERRVPRDVAVVDWWTCLSDACNVAIKAGDYNNNLANVKASPE